MPQSLIPSKVKNTGIDILIATSLIGIAVLGTGFLNKRFGILSKFVLGVSSIGSALGQAVGIGVAQIPIGIGTGAAQAFQPGGKAEGSTRAQLGLDPDTPECTHFPFTNIPLPGSKCGTNPTGEKTPTKEKGTLPPTTPSNPPSVATKNTANIISIIPIKGMAERFEPGALKPRQSIVYRDARQVETTKRDGNPNIIPVKPGQQAIVYATTTGGQRVAVGSPALISRLQQNLRSVAR